jgi:hypothetical protein
MALFGAESENVQKTLLKVQSAMALSEGLQSIGESVDSFKQLGAVIKSTSLYQAAYNFIMSDTIVATEAATVSTVEQTIALEAEAVATTTVATATTGATIALRLFKAALVATGVGALIVGVGYLISKIIEWTDTTKSATEAQDALNKSLATQDEYLNLEIKTIERNNKYRLAKLKEQGGTEAQIAKLNNEGQKKILEAYEEDYTTRFEKYKKNLTRIALIEDKEQKKNAEKASDDLRKQLISDDQRLRDLRVQIRVDNLNEKKRQNDEDLQKQIERIESQIKVVYDGEIKRYEVLKKIREKLGKQEYIDNKKLKEGQKEQQKEDEKNEQDQIEENQKSSLGKFLIAKTKSIQKGYELDKANADAAKILEDEKVKYKEDSANAIADITAGLSSIIGKETAVGKAIAISSATIDTYLSASTIFKQAAKNPISIANPAYPYLMAAPAVLAGIARVKQISSVNVPKGGGAGGGIPSMSGQAPMMPQAPQAQVTQLNQQSINDIGNQAVRAYVIESDVTSNQQRIAAIRQRARFS